MADKKHVRGTLLKGVGGLYEAEIREGNGEARIIRCRARGVLRHEKISPLPGDTVEISLGDETEQDERGAEADTAIEAILDRKNFLIRPPMANLDYLFLVIPAAKPAPMTDVVDKLIALAESKSIEPVILITKEDLDGQKAVELADTYRLAGFDTFILSSLTGDGVAPFRQYLKKLFQGNTPKICAFSGASGAGKSTLMNALFPTLKLESGEISRKISRGKNTTRQTQLYRMAELLGEGFCGYLADTPGFSMLEFTHGFTFPLEDLVTTFREFRPYIGGCRYTKCSHQKEEECAILAAVKAGKVSKSRHASYVAMYQELKQIPEWKRVKMNEQK